MTETVNGSGVYPINTQFQRLLNSCNRLPVILFTPTELPPRAAYGPGTKPDVRYLKFCLA
jgi:hypothetical protein